MKVSALLILLIPLVVYGELPPPDTIVFRMLQPFDQADEAHANGVTGLQVVDVPIELSLNPVNAVLQNDTEVIVSVVGGTATVSFDFSITSSEADETQLVFPAGSIHGEIMNVSVVIWDDLEVEDMETIMLYGSTQPELSASFATGQNRVTLSIIDDDVVIGFQRTSYRVNENGGSVEVCVEVRFGQLRPPDSVTFRLLSQRISRDTRTGRDFQRVRETLTYQQRNMGRPLCRDIVIISDCENETDNNEVFRLTMRLVDANGVDVAFEPARATVFIVDDDDPAPNDIEFAFLPLPVQGDERNPGVLNIPIQITLSPNIAILRADIEASVSVLGGTATEFDDYFAFVSGLTVTFTSGTRNGEIMNAELTILNDIIPTVEATETVVLLGSVPQELPGSKATFDPDRVIVSIFDNDVVLGFQQPHYKVKENADAGCVEVCVEIVAGRLTTPDAIFFEFRTRGNTATPGNDYDPPPVGAELVYGEANSRRRMCKEIEIIDDDEDEADVEEFIVRLVPSTISNNVGVDVVFHPSDTIVKIIDDDEPTLVSVTPTPSMPSPPMMTEQPSMPISMGPSPTPNDGTSCPQQLSCLICNNYGSYNTTHGHVDPYPVHSVVTQPTVTPDPSIEVQVHFSESMFVVGESDGMASVELVLDNIALTTEVVVTVETTNEGSATADVDYTPAFSVLTFSPGDTSTSVLFPVEILDDDLVEGVETIGLSASSSSPQVQFTAGGNSAIVEIIDNDVSPSPTVPQQTDTAAPDPSPVVVLRFSQPLYIVDESDAEAVVQIVVDNGPLTTDVDVVVETTNEGSATADFDYIPTLEVLTFSPGDAAVSVFIHLLEDDLVEGVETIGLFASSHSPLVPFAIGGNSAFVEITDNDLLVQNTTSFAP